MVLPLHVLFFASQSPLLSILSRVAHSWWCEGRRADLRLPCSIAAVCLIIGNEAAPVKGRIDRSAYTMKMHCIWMRLLRLIAAHLHIFRHFLENYFVSIRQMFCPFFQPSSLTFHLTYIILTCYIWQPISYFTVIIWNSVWHLIWHSIWQILWHCIWNSIWHRLWHCHWHSVCQFIWESIWRFLR